MSRTFRRKNHSVVKESQFIGWEIQKNSVDGVCQLTPAEQERIIKRDFHHFHSDTFRLANNGYWYQKANKAYRKLYKLHFKSAYRKQLEDEFIFTKTRKSLYYDLW